MSDLALAVYNDAMALPKEELFINGTPDEAKRAEPNHNSNGKQRTAF